MKIVTVTQTNDEYLRDFWSKESTQTLMEDYHQYVDCDDLTPKQFNVLKIIESILEERGVKF